MSKFTPPFPGGGKNLKRLLLSVFTLGIMQYNAVAQYSNVPVTGFNADEVANGVGDPALSTTGTTDLGVDGATNIFIDGTYKYSSTCASFYTSGIMPANGLVSSTATSGLVYTLQPYSGNNALRIPAVNNITTGSGSLKVITPVAAANLYLLMVTGNGASTSGVNVTVKFTDATTQAFTGISTTDWCSGSSITNYTVTSSSFYRTAANSSSCTSPNTCQYLYEMKLALLPANYSKSVDSIIITKALASPNIVLNIFAVGMQAPCSTPSNQPTALTAGTVGVGSISASFTAATSVPTGYLVVRYPSGATPVAPVNGTTYTAGQSLGTGSIVQVSAATNFTTSGLVNNTAYSFYIYSYNAATNCGGGPVYNITAPLTGTISTSSCTLAGGSYSVGPTGNYTTLTAALSAISTSGITGAVALELQPTYTSTTETYPITLTTNYCISAANNVTIRPASGATALSIANPSTTATTPTIDFSNAYYFTIDGRPGGSGTTQALTISNASTSGFAVRFINDAVKNRILYCTLSGVNTSSTGGVVQFATTTGTIGNDSNSITYCNIGDGATTPTTLVYASGSGTATTQALYNNCDTIANCNLYNFYLASGENNAFKIGNGNGGNANFAILNNSIYQTATRTATATQQQYVFNMNCPLSYGNIVSGNYIGGSAPMCGGTPWTATGAAGITARFTGSYFNFVANGANTILNNNTFANFDWTNPSTSTTVTTPGTWSAFQLVGGSVAITNNNIGDPMVPSISVKSAANANIYGIVGGSGTANTTYNITGNFFGGITTSANTATAPGISQNIIGIAIGSGSSTTYYNVNNNTIGSAMSPSIQAANPSTTTQLVKGIENTGTGIVNIKNNIVQSLDNEAIASGTTVAQIIGINTTAGIDTIMSNTVNSFVSPIQQTSAGTNAAIIGISQTSTTAGAYVAKNTIYDLNATSSVATAAPKLIGINFSETTSGSNIVASNLIHSFSTVSPIATTTNMIGINVTGGNSNIQNNMIRLGIDNSGLDVTTGYGIYGINETGGTNNYYFNSVYIGGSNISAASPTYGFYSSSTSTTARSIQNNIFYNARSVGSGTGNNYAIRIPFTTGLTSNYNDLYSNGGTGSLIGNVNTTDYATLSAWQGGTTLDGNSSSADPKFISPTAGGFGLDLHISATLPTPIEGSGINIATITDDFDGQTRSGLTPTDVGADAGNFVAQDVLPPVITYTPLTSTYTTGNQVITATITDATGVPLTGSLVPRVYFRKGNGGSYFSAPGTFVSGTATNSSWTFTINATTLGGLSSGDSIYYYVIAQDNIATPNVGSNPAGVVATNVNTITTAPIPNGIRILGYLSGTVNVGSGNAFTTLTDVGGLFQQLVSNGLSGNLLVNITSDITEPGTYELTQWPESGAGGYTVKIVPNSATERLISGNTTTGMIRFNGVKKVSIDGRSGGSGRYLRFRNTNTTGPVFTFINDAKSDTVGYSFIEGANTSTGNILFSTTSRTVATGGSGNDSNVVIGNAIRDLSSATAVPSTLINSTGTSTTGLENSDNLISGNEFLNFSSNAINITGTGNGNNWAIIGNSVYQTAARSTSLNVIYVQAGSGHSIIGNSIGGSAANRSGDAFTNTGGVTVNGIYLNVGTAATTVVASNTLSNIAMTTTGSSGVLNGIYVTAGLVNVTGNTLGGGMNAYDTLRSAYDDGLINIGGGTVSITNNIIKNAAYYRAAGDRMAAIYVTSGTTTISGNTVSNIRSNGNGTGFLYLPVGIFINGGSGHTVSNNNISNIYNSNAATGSATAVGLLVASGGSTYSNNRITNVFGVASGTVAPYSYGMYVSSSSTENFYNNQVTMGDSSTLQSKLWGIQDVASSGTHNYFYNTVYLGGTTVGGANSNYAFQKTSGVTVNLRNNILYNSRNITGAGTGFNYAVGSGSATGFAPTTNIAYNLLAATDTSRLVELPSSIGYGVAAYNALFTTTYNTNWMVPSSVVTPSLLFTNTATGDLGTVTTNPESWYVNGKGIAIPGVTTSYNGTARSGSTATGATDIGSTEFTTTTTPPSAAASAAPAASTTTNYIFGGRQIASINWGAAGTVPSAIDVKYYTGVDAPSVGTALHFNSYYAITATGGTGYTYTTSLSYDTSMLGSVTSSASARLAKYATTWITGTTTSSANAATGKLSSTAALTSFGNFTGLDLTTPLAIKLLSFTGAKEGKNNRLDWASASENVGDAFILQRSGNGYDYTDLTTVKAAGKATEYTYYDRAPLTGINNYRLRMVGADKTESFSKVVTLTNTGSISIEAYPNPVTDMLHVDITGMADATITATISDITGKVLQTQQLDANSTTLNMNMQNLPVGVYFLRIVSGEFTKVIKLNKN